MGEFPCHKFFPAFAFLEFLNHCLSPKLGLDPRKTSRRPAVSLTLATNSCLCCSHKPLFPLPMAEFQPLRFLAACFLLVGWAQAQSCFPITGTKMCPSLDGLHVQRSNRFVCFNMSSNFSSFDDVASFDAYVRSQLPQSSAYIREFQDFFQCSGYTGNFARYHLSVFCHFLVEKSGCVQPAPVTSLCQESCNSFITGAIQIFSNSTACDPEADIAVIEERNNYAFNSPFQTFCSELSSVQENPQCSKGEALESKWCGMLFISLTVFRLCNGGGCR